jgi:RNA-directed DNA polymerase
MKPHLRGKVFVVRYADDAVLCFQYREDAEQVLSVLPKRFARYRLTLHPEKTRLVAFGRKALAEASRMGTKLETFDFLGLTHKCARSRRGKFTVHVKTMKKRLRRSLKGVAEWCRVHRHDSVDKQQAILNAKLRGHYQYYGRPTNYRSLWQFHRGVRQIWKKWLGRRSRGRTLTWAKYEQLLKRHPLMRPRILRPALARRVLPEEPTGVIPQGGVCEGGGFRQYYGEPKRARSRKRRIQTRAS